MGLSEPWPVHQAPRQKLSKTAMNLADPELELIDPTPNVHAMFVQFDTMFFWSTLIRQTTVKWSKRMYSCAGVCSFDGQQNSITLSEPLLKLRPRKDLVQTLLHEMIHAYCFATNTDRSRDGHGPIFQGHMHRINRAAGLNITIYHDFHDEVKVYQTHWWRCNGVCQNKRPYFGIVRRSINKAPGPGDRWWRCHQAMCGGTFIKIKEPDKNTRRKSSANTKSKVNVTNKTNSTSDITKYVNVTTGNVTRPALKDSNINTLGSVSNTKPKMETIVFKGQGLTVSSGPKERFVDAAEAVRKAWANKTINNTSTPKFNTPVPKINTPFPKINTPFPKINTPFPKINTPFPKINTPVPKINTPVPKINKPVSKVNTTVPKKHKATDHVNSPPTKTRKIDDFFPAANAILKDLYGEGITVSKKENSIIVSATKCDLVECPICNGKINSQEINSHIDVCLNKDIITSLSEENVKTEASGKILINGKTETSKDVVNIKTEPGTSKEPLESLTKCPCCSTLVSKPMEEHLDECLAFLDNETTVPEEGASTSFITDTIVIDDDEDDVLNESAIFNASGTKNPCPCCMKMVEASEMNRHLDTCLISSDD